MSILFKYMSEPHNLLEDGYIRATQQCALNDPFEAQYSASGLHELSKDFCCGYVKGNSSLDENIYINHIEQYINHIGVISLSEVKDNLLMWSHYANNHKGLAVGLLFLDSIFEQLFQPDSIKTGIFPEHTMYDGKPKAVNYRKSLKYLNDKYDHDYTHIVSEGLDRVLHDIFLQKSDEWIYEKEHRIILRLEQADLVKIQNYENLNEVIKELIKENGAVSIDGDHASINLQKILNAGDRDTIASELAKKSTNPNNIYLFKLSRNSIHSCIHGLNNISNQNLIPNDRIKLPFFESLQAKINNGYYSLDFETRK